MVAEDLPGLEVDALLPPAHDEVAVLGDAEALGGEALAVKIDEARLHRGRVYVQLGEEVFHRAVAEEGVGFALLRREGDDLDLLAVRREELQLLERVGLELVGAVGGQVPAGAVAVGHAVDHAQEREHEPGDEGGVAAIGEAAAPLTTQRHRRDSRVRKVKNRNPKVRSAK